jgi:hypothetical protein
MEILVLRQAQDEDFGNVAAASDVAGSRRHTASFVLILSLSKDEGGR